jgi:PII-like signaling protein
MDLNKDTRLLRIFMSNTDKFKNKPLYEVIVYAAQRFGIAGATVLKGIMSFGESSRINSLKFWEVSEKLPVVIEIIDEANKIESFFESIKPYFEKINKGFIVTIEKVNVVLYKTGKKK